MTKEEIIDIVMQIGMCDRPEDDSPALKMFISFAKLISEKEREECAKVCDEFPDVGYIDKKLTSDYHAHLIRQRRQA